MNNWSEVLSGNVYKYGAINEPNTFYIDAINGSDTVNRNGSPWEPWQTIGYAITRVTNPGSTIILNSGVYNIAAQVVIPEEISIKGQSSQNTIIRSTVPLTYTLLLASLAEGTNGNQEISGIRFEGNLTGFSPIGISARSNVIIKDCEFEGFLNRGVCFDGAVAFANSVAGTNRATGNKVLNCRFINNALTFNQGNINIGGQNGIEIAYNWIEQPDRGGGDVGMGIKTLYNGYCEGCKIHHNHIWINPWDGVGGHWDFGIELVHNLGGMEINHNWVNGRIDISSLIGGVDACNDAMGYGFAFKVHHNWVGQETLRNRNEVAIDFEHDCNGGIYIYKNRIQNVFRGIYHSMSGNMFDFNEYYNIITNIGTLGAANIGNGIHFEGAAGNAHRFKINNNIIIGDPGEVTLTGIYRTAAGLSTNFEIRNNIIMGFDDAAIDFSGGGTYDMLDIQNNIFFGNGTNGVVHGASTFTYETTAGNIIADPLLLPNFHLDAGSPAINAGLNIFGMITDYDEKLIINIPNIGCFE